MNTAYGTLLSFSNSIYQKVHATNHRDSNSIYLDFGISIACFCTGVDDQNETSKRIPVSSLL